MSNLQLRHLCNFDPILILVRSDLIRKTISIEKQVLPNSFIPSMKLVKNVKLLYSVAPFALKLDHLMT